MPSRLSNTKTESVCDHYAGNLKFAHKAFDLQEEFQGSFEITLDLEDGAESGNKERLANDFLEIICSNKNAFKNAGIRLPEANDPSFRSLATVFLSEKSAHLNHITIPKVQSFSEFSRIKASLIGIIKSNAASLPPLRILIEHPSVLSELDLISKDDSVETLEIGIMDFISAMGGIVPMDECSGEKEFNNPLLQSLKSQVSTTAIRNNKTAVHSVCREFKDQNKIESFCLQAKKSGFGKMWSIHPSQIPVIIKTFTPSEEELEEAASILKLAAEKNWGPVSFKETLHDMASYRYYDLLLKRASKLGIVIESEAPKLPVNDCNNK